MIETLKALCSLVGVSSHEEAVRNYIAETACPYADEIRSDAIGNLIVFKRGKKATGQKFLMAAHMDEVGLIIRAITEEGYLKFLPVGAIDRRVLIGRKVLVGEKQLPGIIGLKAYHLVGKEEEKTVPKLREFYIDIGARSKAEAEALVSPGDVAGYAREFLPFGNGYVRTPALDDRVGCAVMLELLKTELPFDCTFVFSAQEEVGTRGAFGAAFAIKPEFALVFEGTTAADIPSMEAHKQVCSPGKGPVIPFMDAGTISDRALFELMRDVAEKNGIAWQMKEYIAGGTDAAAIQRSRCGVRVVALSAAVRYLHTASSVLSVADYEQIIRLSALFLEAVADEL